MGDGPGDDGHQREQCYARCQAVDTVDQIERVGGADQPPYREERAHRRAELHYSERGKGNSRDAHTRLVHEKRYERLGRQLPTRTHRVYVVD